MENVSGVQGLALQQLKNLNHHKISFLDARNLKRGHFDIFDTLFLFLAFFTGKL